MAVVIALPLAAARYAWRSGSSFSTDRRIFRQSKPLPLPSYFHVPRLDKAVYLLIIAGVLLFSRSSTPVFGATVGQDLFTDTAGTFLESHTPDVGSSWQVPVIEKWVIEGRIAGKGSQSMSKFDWLILQHQLAEG